MKKGFSHIALLLVFLVYSAAIFAQNPRKEPLYFQTYTIGDGLSDNWVRDITKDQQGYLWIATRSGVSRFDGYEFEIFRNEPADSTSLSGNDAFAIHTDRENNVWIATAAGIDRFDRSSLTFKHYQVDAGTFSNLRLPDASPVSKFYESDNGTLYIGTAGGLAIFDVSQQEFRMISADAEEGSALSHPEVTSITESPDGRLWIGTYGGGINILDPETGTITFLRNDPDDVTSLPNDYIFNLFIDLEQVLWVNYDFRENQQGLFNLENVSSSRGSGLWKKELNTGLVQHYLYNPERGNPLWAFISDFEQTRDRNIWISQNRGFGEVLQLYNNEAGTFFGYSYDVTDPGTLPWLYGTSLLEDQSDQLWVGTSRGLARADRSQILMNAFTPVPNDRYSLDNSFYGIEEVNVDHFLISRDVRATISWNRNTNTWNEIPEIPSYRKPVVYDGKEYVWILSIQNTIERVHLETHEKQIYNLNKSSAGSITINHFLRLSNEVLLVATSEGLWKLTPSSGKFEKIDLSFRYPTAEESDIAYLVADSTGSVWLGINNATLDPLNSRKGILVAKYDPATDQTVYPDINDSYLSAFGNGFANHLMTDSKGRVWVSKSNGLVRFEPKTKRTTFYNTQYGLQHLTVLGTLEDNLGMIWICKEYGISRLNPDTGSIRNFDIDNGLRPSRINPHSFYKRENGELIFGGVGGLSYFHPEDVRESDDPPRIHLTSLEMGETFVNLSGTGAGESPIEIDWGSNSISVEFVSVNFRNPRQTTYIYKLEGFHNDWVDAGTRRFAQFSNLPPKRYIFQVRAVNVDGTTSTEAASVSFTVLPPWYRTWWAYGFYLIFLIVGVVTVDRILRKRVQEQNRKKAREKELEQAKEIEKAYKNLEVAHENLKSAQDQLIQQEKLASLGQLTAGIAHEIQNPLNFVNNFSEVSAELMEELKGERLKVNGERDEAVEEEIIGDVIQNLEKINHHGKRADAIVKGMLEHSRTSSGEKVPTDINALADEYLRLSYHGMRAKDKSFNAVFETHFDLNLPKVNVVPQDIGRVLLNIINNAFQAVGTGHALSLQPLVTVSTSTLEGGRGVRISIKDNAPAFPPPSKTKSSSHSLLPSLQVREQGLD
ncbi:two-component regulator propeller domain-containing protein [Aquiflexum sp.]|uniref:ligand-binding sensor domain-containing protein n=1 Tax=Aquiflexum sp. TaxID=1872584 RepID=UPI0035931D9B